MSPLRESLETVRRHAAARSVVLLTGPAGLLGLDEPVFVGELPDAFDSVAAFGGAMSVPGRTGGEIAQRVAAIFGERRRAGVRRPLLRVALPDSGGAWLLLERGDEPGPSPALALAFDALAAVLRPPTLPAEVAEAAAFLARDSRAALLVDRTGRPIAVSPLLRQVLGGDRNGRPFVVAAERRPFFTVLRRRLGEGAVRTFPAEGLAHAGDVHLRPLLGGAFYLAVLRGDVAQGASLRALADSDVTPREITCGLRLAEGKSYREIASDLDVSPDTVKLHLRALYQKLGVDGRDGLVARMANLAPPPPIVRGIGRRA